MTTLTATLSTALEMTRRYLPSKVPLIEAVIKEVNAAAQAIGQPEAGQAIRRRGRPPTSGSADAPAGTSNGAGTAEGGKLSARVWATMVKSGKFTKPDLIKRFPNERPNQIGAALARFVKAGKATREGEWYSCPLTDNPMQQEQKAA